jgi:hypothetical protein
MPNRNSANTRGRATARMKREKAIRALVEGHNWAEVAAIAGYTSTGAAHQAVSIYLKENPSPEADQLRQIETLKLNDLERHARTVLERFHITVQHGKIVGPFTGFARDPETDEIFHDDNGKPIPLYEPLRDDGPELAAVQALIKIAERRAKLNGLDMPVTIKLEQENSELDAEIAGLVDELNVNGLPSVPEGSNEAVT